MRHPTLALLPLLFTACTATLQADTEPATVEFEVFSVVEPIYAEVAIDLPPETRGIDVTVESLTADVVVVNPSKSVTLRTSARLSLEGTATPQNPKLYTQATLPKYYATAAELLKDTNYAPNTSTPVNVAKTVGLEKLVGAKTIWIIASNTAVSGGIGTVELPLKITLKDAVLHITVSKNLEGLEGALSVGGL